VNRSDTQKTLAETMAAIQALDLAPIKFKATRQEDGYGWTPQHADAMEVEYKRYLILHAKDPSLALAPERDVDRFWHMHILDTRKYAADCDAVFGRFVHHFPYLGLRAATRVRADAGAVCRDVRGTGARAAHRSRVVLGGVEAVGRGVVLGGDAEGATGLVLGGDAEGAAGMVLGGVGGRRVGLIAAVSPSPACGRGSW
jgi:hypothetical protein